MVTFLFSATQAERNWWFNRETLIEQARQRLAPTLPSRLQAFFAFPDEETAQECARAWGWDVDNLVEVGILQGASISQHDSRWIEEMGNTPTVEQAEAYVRGQSVDQNPRWELLVEGTAVIFGTEARMRALEVVNSVWPRSLFFLENARIAALLGETAGYVGAWPARSPEGNAKICWIMDDEAFKSPDYLVRLKAFYEVTPKSEILSILEDLRTEIVAPDMRPYQFEIAADVWLSLFGRPR